MCLLSIVICLFTKGSTQVGDESPGEGRPAHQATKETMAGVTAGHELEGTMAVQAAWPSSICAGVKGLLPLERVWSHCVTHSFLCRHPV